jgi:hypothetical protein
MGTSGFAADPAKETRKAARQTRSSQRNVFRASARGMMGLKKTAIETNAAAQEYLPACHACVTTSKALTQIRISNVTW